MTRGVSAFSVVLLFCPLLILFLFRFLGRESIMFPFKLYPVLINLSMLFSFGISLFRPQTAVFRFAVLSDKELRNSPNLPRIEKYCRRVTQVWCLFFLLNGSAALITALSSDWVWVAYNGFVSYILIGILFGAEYFVRKRVQRGLS